MQLIALSQHIPDQLCMLCSEWTIAKKKQQHKTVDSTSLIEICTVIQINFVTIESNA